VKYGVKRPRRRPRIEREDNIKMDLKNTRWEVVSSMILIKAEKVSGCCRHGNEPSGPEKYGVFVEWLRNY
jgi:hypothetical protein